MEKQFINLTPHDVVLYDRKDCIVLPGGKGYGFSDENQKPLPLVTFPPSGEVARATQQEEALPPVIGGGIEIPVSRMTYGAPVGLPEPREGVAYIVSALTANAAKAAGRTTDDLYLTQGMIREGNGIVGCVGFAQL